MAKPTAGLGRDYCDLGLWRHGTPQPPAGKGTGGRVKNNHHHYQQADRQTDRRSTSPTRLDAPGPSHRRRGSRPAGSLTRGLHCPGAPVVRGTTTSAQQKTRDQGMTKPPSLSSQPSLPTTKTSVEYNTNFCCFQPETLSQSRAQPARSPARPSSRLA